MHNDFSRDHLPRGWNVARWNAAKREVRAVIWQRGLAGKPITYKGLTSRLTQERLFWRSPILAGLLNEIAREERDDGGPWVTALVTLSGRRFSGGGLFAIVPEVEWVRIGKVEFCEQQQQLAVKWIRDHPEAEASSSASQVSR